jgi:hypothetical protein
MLSPQHAVQPVDQSNVDSQEVRLTSEEISHRIESADSSERGSEGYESDVDDSDHGSDLDGDSGSEGFDAVLDELQSTGRHHYTRVRLQSGVLASSSTARNEGISIYEDATAEQAQWVPIQQESFLGRREEQRGRDTGIATATSSSDAWTPPIVSHPYQQPDNSKSVSWDHVDVSTSGDQNPCPICMGSFTTRMLNEDWTVTHAAVKTECGHLFGGSCLWKVKSSSKNFSRNLNWLCFSGCTSMEKILALSAVMNSIIDITSPSLPHKDW